MQVSALNKRPEQPKLSSSASQRHLLEMVTEYQARMREDTTKLEELAEYTSVITMGTVDAGKSTIFGHLVYLA